MNIAWAIQKTMEIQRISQQQLSKKTGISRNYIYKIINGYHSPSVFVIQRLAEGMDMKTSELIAFAEGFSGEAGKPSEKSLSDLCDLGNRTRMVSE